MGIILKKTIGIIEWTFVSSTFCNHRVPIIIHRKLFIFICFFRWENATCHSFTSFNLPFGTFHASVFYFNYHMSWVQFVLKWLFFFFWNSRNFLKRGNVYGFNFWVMLETQLILQSNLYKLTCHGRCHISPKTTYLQVR